MTAMKLLAKENVENKKQKQNKETQTKNIPVRCKRQERDKKTKLIFMIAG